MIFTAAERAYLDSQQLGRLSTLGPDGAPQTRPVSFRVNDDGTIYIGGPDNETTRKYKNVQARPEVSFVVDDLMGPDEMKPGFGRGVEVRGRAEVVTLEESPIAPGFFSNEMIRVHPKRIISWQLEPEREQYSRSV
jgi:pyridoxamine 5'-phosphate oxidase family protein